MLLGTFVTCNLMIISASAINVAAGDRDLFASGFGFAARYGTSLVGYTSTLGLAVAVMAKR